jgi:hypothetical protein
VVAPRTSAVADVGKGVAAQQGKADRSDDVSAEYGVVILRLKPMPLFGDGDDCSVIRWRTRPGPSPLVKPLREGTNEGRTSAPLYIKPASHS